ncbi:hypothetical protein [Streptomyces sp. NBC_01497]|uniref:hypothetical protein n=1 Tax=Streptomyces sp. NBC_01497 TaxID=2903885 RepID=UPI002E36229E|nr:hypothetical protein [Streptomyces sp. NBC_01497]
MNTTVIGLLTGLALGFAGYFGGFGALVVVAVVGAAGLLVGYLARRDGYVAGLLRDHRADGREDRFLPGRDDGRRGRRPRERYEGGSARPEPRPRAPFRERVQ